MTFETLNVETSDHSEKPMADESQNLRSEMILLAEKHEIKQSVANIKKASHSALENIKNRTRKKTTRGNQRISIRNTHG